MSKTIKEYQKKYDELGRRGFSIYDDGQVSLWDTPNPRDAYQEFRTYGEFLAGRFQADVRRDFGQPALEEALRIVTELKNRAV